MRSFDRLTAIAAPFPFSNIDTDKILPARFLKTIRRDGLGQALFYTLRFDGSGQERPSFVLNQQPWRCAKILIARDNFGCGSSREHAPWALTDFGFRCVIATGFADIFYSNCFKNGILPIVAERALVEALLSDAADPARATLTVDLETQSIRRSDGSSISFEISAERKRALLLGLDEIAETLALMTAVTAYEASRLLAAPAIPGDIAERALSWSGSQRQLNIPRNRLPCR